MADKQEDAAAFLKDSGEPDMQHAVDKANEVIDQLHNVVLNIAITGISGAGKSSFVNAIRGVKDTDEGAAPVDETECTTKPVMYPHPTMPNVRIWDLPGIGTEKVTARTYTKKVNFQDYDFFIIISQSRFDEREKMLASEIKGKKKFFYFVRSKVDQDVANAEDRGVTEDETLQKIKKNCEENLRDLKSPPVFLISTKKLERFDFSKLINALERDLPHYKSNALIISLPVCSKECLERKYNVFQEVVWVLAIASGGIAAVPVPGLSAACDVSMVAAFFTKCYHSFGLDDESLKDLGKRVDKPILEMVKTSKLVKAIASKTFLTTKMAGRLLAAGAIEGLCLLLPGVGSVAAAGISYVTTKAVLQKGLEEMYKVAQKVIEMAELD